MVYVEDRNSFLFVDIESGPDGNFLSRFRAQSGVKSNRPDSRAERPKRGWGVLFPLPWPDILLRLSTG